MGKEETDCSHDLPCEAAAVQPLGTAGRCEDPKVFTPGGSSPLYGTGGSGESADALSLLEPGLVTGKWGANRTGPSGPRP